MAASRRQFLLIAGGGVILAAGASAVAYGVTRNPTSALQPWRDAGSRFAEPRRKALSFALLAPNPHNRQPWVVDLSETNTVKLYVDLERLLPATDPYNRQITIGLGCFLELMRMAAAEDGYDVEIVSFPEGADTTNLDHRPAAVCTFTKSSSVQPDPLFRRVLERRSLKEPYDIARPVSVDSLAKLTGLSDASVAVAGTIDPDRVDALRAFTREAMDIEMRLPRTMKESADLFRIGKSEIEANPDGIDFSGLKFEALAAFGFMSREATMDPTSEAFAQGHKIIMEQMDTAMGHVWITTLTNTRADQLSAGRMCFRTNLAATDIGLGKQPLSQSLQEFPEMAANYKKVHIMLAPQGGTVQMLARIGYGPDVPVSPRWPLDAKIAQA